MFKPDKVKVAQTAVTHSDSQCETGLSSRYWLTLLRTGNSLLGNVLTYEMEVTIFLILPKESSQE